MERRDRDKRQVAVLDIMKELSDRRSIIDKRLVGIFDPIEQPVLRDAMEYLVKAGGKRLRPICTMLTYEMFGNDPLIALPFALGVELIHNFTLIHDDIMDEDDLRRGVPTVHKAYDTATAINAGDGLYSHALTLMSRSDCPDDVFRRLVEEMAVTVRGIGEGQQSDIEFEKRNDVAESEYLNMIENKTARIFEHATRGGALIAGADDKEIEAVGEFGKNFGISFQLFDDYLDLMSSTTSLGKTVGADLRKNKKTLIIVTAYERGTEKQRRELRQIWGDPAASEEDIVSIISILESSGAIDETKKKAMCYSREAKRCLEPLPDTTSKEILICLADYNLVREF